MTVTVGFCQQRDNKDVCVTALRSHDVVGQFSAVCMSRFFSIPPLVDDEHLQHEVRLSLLVAWFQDDRQRYVSIWAEVRS